MLLWKNLSNMGLKYLNLRNLNQVLIEFICILIANEEEILLENNYATAYVAGYI